MTTPRVTPSQGKMTEPVVGGATVLFCREKIPGGCLYPAQVQVKLNPSPGSVTCLSAFTLAWSASLRFFFSVPLESPFLQIFDSGSTCRRTLTRTVICFQNLDVSSQIFLLLLPSPSPFPLPSSSSSFLMVFALKAVSKMILYQHGQAG